jgi:Ca-activated chloride channel family protein
MSFARPELLYLAILVPLLLGTAVWLFGRRRRRIAALYSDPHLLDRLGGAGLHRFPAARLACIVSAGFFGALAAAGPQWGVRATEGRPLALNVALAADISRSMLAADLEPNRLERARLFARRLLHELPGDRFGLVVFAGRSYTLSPLTVDHSAIELYLDALEPGMVSMGGSAMAAAIRQATDLLSGTDIERGERVAILLSDGEATEEQPEVRAAAERAARAGVRIVTVGFGTPAGASIRIRDDTTGEDRLVRNEFGEVHVTRLDEPMLRQIAARTRGIHVRGDQPGAVGQVVAELRGMERGAGAAAGRLEPVDRAPLFAAGALLFLLLDALVAAGRRAAPARTAPAAVTDSAPPGRRRAARAARATVIVLALLAGTGFGPSDLERGNRLYREGRYEEAVAAYRRVLEGGRTAPEVHYNLGTALLALGNYAEAEQQLRAALQGVDPALRHRSFYNLGNRFLDEGRAERDVQRQGRLLDAAIDAYRRALRIDPADSDAKWNLELALRDRENNRLRQAASPQPHEDRQGEDGQDRQEQDASGVAAGGTAGQSPAGEVTDTGTDTDRQQMSREQAERILSAIEQDERDLTRDRLRRGQRSVPVLRDW